MCELLCVLGGIMAGLISDYTNGRATTCCIMLILAAPMVRIRARAKCACSYVPVRAAEMCAHLRVYAHVCLRERVPPCACWGRSQGWHRTEIQTENSGKGLARVWPWWRRGRPAAKLPGPGKKKLRLDRRKAFLRNRKQQLPTS